MANKKLITFYVSKVVEPIRKKMNIDAEGLGLEADFTNEMVDTIIKHRTETDKSKIVMSNEELQEVIVEGFKLGDELGLSLDYPKGELDDLLEFKDLK